MATHQESKTKLNKKIVITGGGSGGHISPAQAVIEILESRYTNALEQILYIGGNLPMEGEKDGESVEQKIFKSSKINFVAIRAGKLQRYFKLSTIKSLFNVLGGIFDAYKELKQFKPDLIFSTGGFVTVPVCFVGWIMHIPVYIHEQTAAVGLTNKITSLFAKQIFITFSASFKHFPRKKTLLTGNPVRKDIFKNNPDKQWTKVLNKMRNIMVEQSKPIILVVGGGQGSHLFNETIGNALTALLKKYQIIISTGSNTQLQDYEMLMRKKDKLPEESQDSFFPTKFIEKENIGAVFANSQLVISRAGANFVYELGILKKRTIFVPIPWVTNNEQEKNARTLERQDLASIILEKEFTTERLLTEIDNTITKAIPKDFDNSLFPIDAAKKIVGMVVK